jgi:hypothetical protein
MSELIVFEYQGEQVAYDPADQMWNLTAMHRASGGDPAKAPAQWSRLSQAQEFIAALAEELTVRKSHSLVVTREGRNGGTWAHWQIAAAYAHYLNPRFYLQWNRWAMERKQQIDGRAAPGDLLAQIAELARRVAVLEQQRSDQVIVVGGNIDDLGIAILNVIAYAADHGRAYGTTELLAACGLTRRNPGSFYRRLAQLRNGGFIAKSGWSHSSILITEAGRELLDSRLAELRVLYPHLKV